MNLKFNIANLLNLGYVDTPTKVRISVKKDAVRRYIYGDGVFTPDDVLMGMIIARHGSVPQNLADGYGPELVGINGTLANLAATGVLERVGNREYRANGHNNHKPQTVPIEEIPTNGIGPDLTDRLQEPSHSNGHTDKSIPEEKYPVSESSEPSYTIDGVFNHVVMYLGRTFMDTGRTTYTAQEIEKVVRSHIPDEQVPNMPKYLMSEKLALREKAGLPSDSNLFPDETVRNAYQNKNGYSKRRNGAQNGHKPDGLDGTVKQYDSPSDGQPEIPQEIHWAALRLSKADEILQKLLRDGEVDINRNYHYWSARGGNAGVRIQNDIKHVLYTILRTQGLDKSPKISISSVPHGVKIRVGDDLTSEMLQQFVGSGYNLDKMVRR